jgi:hypothetical protein
VVCSFCLFFKKFVSKACVFESFKWGIIPLDFMGFHLGLSNQKMTSTTLNSNFHIDLGMFVGD